jgi:hypothetical protein
MSTCKGDVKVEHVKEAAAEMCKVLENSDFFPTNPRNNGNKVVDVTTTSLSSGIPIASRRPRIALTQSFALRRYV